MPKLNKEIKIHLLYLLGMLLAFIASVWGLDKLNTKLDKDINGYKEGYEEQKAQLQQVN